jgi:signal transduction histidine kinase
MVRSVWIALVAMTICIGAWAGNGAAEKPTAPESDLTLDLVALVDDAASLVAEKGSATACKDFREPGPWFQGESYIFLLDMTGTMVCNPSSPELEGQNLIDFKDPLGKPVAQNILREVQRPSAEGWTHYLWPRPEFMTSFWKTSYFKKVADADGNEVVVASGLYEIEMEPFFVVEQVEDAVSLILEQGEQAFDTFRDPASGFIFYDAYVFVMEISGEMLVNPGFPELEGNNILDLKDVDGKPFVRQGLERLESAESTWVQYRWPRPGKAPTADKTSYLRRLELDDRTLVVGAGVYF